MTNHTQIFNSVKQNNLRQVTLLLQGGCDVNVTNTSSQTLLMAALVHIYDAETRVRIVTQLLKAGADVNKVDKKRKSPLSYACALNQPEAVAVLLRQPTIDPNAADYDGVTPLMLAAQLGNIEVIKVLMEASQAGSVTIDLSVKDNNGQTALDHARKIDTADVRASPSGDGRSVSNSVEITRLLAACGGAELPAEAGSCVAGTREGPVNPSSSEEYKNAIEMVDMSGSSPRREPFGSKGIMAAKVITATASASTRENPVSKEHQSDPTFNEDTARKWAENLKQEHESAGRLSSLVSPAPCSRPGSRQGGSAGGKGGGIPLRDKHPPLSKSSLEAIGGNHLRPGSAKKGGPSYRPTSRLRASTFETGDDDDDEDISLESLSELLGTVRQYAREIHEIYAPIQKEEEQRIRKKRERLARKKSRELEKTSQTAPLAPPATSQQHEVRVEIHAIEEQLKQRVQGKHLDRSRPQGPAHSRSLEPPLPSGAPVAMLTVEDEQLLSSTWPRGRLRPKSRERFWSDTTSGHGTSLGESGAGQSSVSYPCSPSTSFTASDRLAGRFHATQGAASRAGGSRGGQAGEVDPSSIQQERDILNKAFQKIHRPKIMLKAFNKNMESSTAVSGKKADRQLQEQVITSRQSVIQVARQHQQNRQGPVSQLPSISIIGPMEKGEEVTNAESGAPDATGGVVGGVLPSTSIQNHEASSAQNRKFMVSSTADAAPARETEAAFADIHGNSESSGHRHVTRPSRDGGAVVKSSNNRPGLRHRRSVDKGLGSGVMLEKY